MSITSGIVLYLVIWWMVFYMILPLWQVSQSEAGHVEPGTPASAPVDAKLKKKALITTAIATVVFAIAFSVIEFRLITLDQISWIEPPARN